MKKPLFKGLLVFAFSIVSLLAYQNCGEVGGMGPFSSYNLDPEDGQEGETSTQLRLQLLGASISYNNSTKRYSLTMSINCNYNPFSFHNHRIDYKLKNSNGHQTHSWSNEKCNGGGPVTFDLGQLNPGTSSLEGRIYGKNKYGQWVEGGPNSFFTGAQVSMEGFYPQSVTAQTTETYSSLAQAGVVNVSDALGANSHPYTALRGKLEFKVNSVFTLNTFYGLFEFLPYQYNGSNFSEYIMTVSRQCTATGCPTTSPNYEYFKVSQIGLTTNRPNQDIRAFFADTRRAFQQGKTYIIDFTFNGNGGFSFKMYEKGNPGSCLTDPSSCLYYDIAAVDYDMPSRFGLDAMNIHLGSAQYAPAPVSNVKLTYRACGYVGSTPDTACINGSL